MAETKLSSLINVIIAILENTSNISKATANISGLPKAFHTVEKRLPLVKETLGTTCEFLRNNHFDEGLCDTAMPVVMQCREKAECLEKVFYKSLPKYDSWELKQYRKAATVNGKTNRVEFLMKGMLDDVQLLIGHQHLGLVSKGVIGKDHVDQLAEAIDEVLALPSSLPIEGPKKTSYFKGFSFGNGTTEAEDAADEMSTLPNEEQKTTPGVYCYNFGTGSINHTGNISGVRNANTGSGHIIQLNTTGKNKTFDFR